MDLLEQIVPVAFMTDGKKRTVQETLRRILPYEVEAPQEELSMLQPPPLVLETIQALEEGLADFTSLLHRP